MVLKEIDEQKINKSLEEARKALKIEADAVLELIKTVNDNFQKVMETIILCDGRIIFTGVGKTGLVAKKLAATFSSTGTSAFFVHAGEALHGDLGMIKREDIVIAVSNSGETDEVLDLIPSIRRIGAKLIALTGSDSSTLADYSDMILEASIENEACPNDLAPTASTTAAIALGDSLAIALSKYHGFKPEDFAIYHPGGSLGRKLLTKVSDIIKIREENPMIKNDKSVREALFLMTESHMGSVSIVDDEGIFKGIITDGDIRRLLEKSIDFIEKPVKEFMTENPVTVAPNKLAAEALNIMEKKEVNVLPVVENNKPIATINLQDVLRIK